MNEEMKTSEGKVVAADITLSNPNRDQAAIAAMRRMLIERQHAFVDEIEAATEAITADGCAKMRLNAFDAYKDKFSKAGKALAKEIAAQSGADAVFSQLTASESAVKEAIRAYKERLRAANDENEPSAEKLEYIIELCVTQRDYDAIAKKLLKDGVEFRSRRVKDNESAKIDKLFREG